MRVQRRTTDSTLAGMNHVSVRLDSATMARVDAMAPAFSTEWRRATRSDILRGLILASLDRFEQAAAAAPAPARKTRRATRPRR